jgi:hypothetical protein
MVFRRASLCRVGRGTAVRRDAVSDARTQIIQTPDIVYERGGLAETRTAAFGQPSTAGEAVTPVVYENVGG